MNWGSECREGGEHSFARTEMVLQSEDGNGLSQSVSSCMANSSFGERDFDPSHGMGVGKEGGSLFGRRPGGTTLSSPPVCHQIVNQ